MEILDTIIRIAPNAVESKSYGMSAYTVHKKPLIYFAAYKNHIDLYATPSMHTKFATELSMYKQGKGSVQFPITTPLPITLIAEIIICKVQEIQSAL